MKRIRIVSVAVICSLTLLCAKSAQSQSALLSPLIAFGTVNTGSTSASAITLTNNGSASTTISQVSVTGNVFSASGIATPYALPPGATVTLTLTFTPTAATTYSGSAMIASDAANSPLSIALSGTGTQAAEAQLTAGPASENFGNVSVGSTVTQTITLTNTGNVSATISQVSASGSGFSVSGVSPQLTLAAGATTMVKVTFSPTVAGPYSGSIAIASNASNSTLSVPLAGMGTTTVSASAPLCGQVDDKLVHLPPNWETFVPPATGQSYVDPVFGCTVKRLTNSAGGEEAAWNGTYVSFAQYYSTFTPMNAADTMLFIIANDGYWRIKDTNGNVVVAKNNIPDFGGHPVWDASNGNVFYYTHGAALYRGTVTGNSVANQVLHTFTEYSSITAPDDADLSQDGDHILLAGQNPDNTMDVFVWSLSQQTKTSKYTTTCTVSGSIEGPQPGCLHKIQLTPNNLMAIEFQYDGTGAEQGTRLWTGTNLVHLQDTTNHYDTGSDLNGNPVFIAMNNSYSLAGLSNPCPSGWGLDVRQLTNLQASTCLLDDVPFWHVSYRGGASQPWLALSFFDGRTPGPELFNTNANYRAPSISNWQLYEDEIMLADVDGSAIYRLAHARSRSVESFWATPRAAISRDGKYVIFTSNMANPNGCPANMYVANECSDVYLIKVH